MRLTIARPARQRTVRSLWGPGANILLLLFALSLALVLLEGAARVLYRPVGQIIHVNKDAGSFRLSDDPVLLWELRKDSEGINSYGFRNEEFQVQKEPGTYRILVLGDSIIYGSGTRSLDEIFTEQLKALLNATPGSYEVINAGMPGYNTVQEYRFFQTRGKQLEPDLVILAYFLNDALDGAPRIRILLEGFEVEYRLFEAVQVIPGTLSRELLFRSHLYRWLNAKLYVILGSSQNSEVFSLPQKENDNALLALADDVRASGADLLVLVFPKLTDPPLTAEHERIHGLLVEHNVTSIDLADEFLSYPLDDIKSSPDDIAHPSGLGHRLAAEAAYDHLVSNGLMGLGNAGEPS